MPKDDSRDAAGLDTGQRNQLRNLLLEARERLTARRKGGLERAVRPTDDVPDEGDLAAQAEDERTLMQLAEGDRARLREIDAALVRLRDGTYGLDEETGEPIGFARLRAIPWARRGIHNEEQQERS
jgi:DnaK suppressor protein